MSVSVVIPPAEAPVSLELAKQHLEILNSDRDDLIELQIEAAVNKVEEFTGRALIDQTLDAYFDAFPDDGGPLEIPKPPLIEVQGVFYVDSAGDVQEFTGFEVDPVSQPARLYLPVSGTWPTIASVKNAVQVRFRAGYLDNNSPQAENVPAALKVAMLMYLGTWFRYREEITSETVMQLPDGAKKLLRDYRVLKGMA